jgi:pyruvate dehydrogenase E2 component (dihydrolipoamide acetyltransferase)
MATEVRLPRLGQGMEAGTIVRWLKAEREPVRKGEPLYELDTDKVTQEVEAEADGVLLKILLTEGEAAVGTLVALIGAAGEDVSVASKPAPAVEAPKPEPAPPAETAPPSSPEPPLEPRAARLKASPLARRLARERGVDLAVLRGTGPEGRVVAEDVERGGTAPPPAAAPATGVEVVPLSQTRKTIARRLTEAWQAPVFELSVSADMTRALALRERLVAGTAEGEVRPTVNDVLTKLAAAALVRHPAVNAHFAGDAIHRFGSAHVGIAVAAPNGLVVPVIRDADRRPLAELAAVRADLVSRARAGKLQLTDLEGGTFTISNLGMFGVEEFTAVLNPPQAAILAVGSIEERPAVVDGELTVRPLMHMTLTCDHRAIDGADGAEFLRTLRELLEEPGLAL